MYGRYGTTHKPNTLSDHDHPLGINSSSAIVMSLGYQRFLGDCEQRAADGQREISFDEWAKQSLSLWTLEPFESQFKKEPHCLDYDWLWPVLCILSFVWVFSYHNSVPFVTGMLKSRSSFSLQGLQGLRGAHFSCPNEPSSMNSEGYTPKGPKD